MESHRRPQGHPGVVGTSALLHHGGEDGREARGRLAVHLPGEGGEEHAFRGSYWEVQAPERLVFTFEYEGMPGHVDVETPTLEELPGGGTRMTVRAVFDSIEERDGMLKWGMESGAAETCDRLEAYLRKARR